jgi:hypothetical protein
VGATELGPRTGARWSTSRTDAAPRSMEAREAMEAEDPVEREGRGGEGIRLTAAQPLRSPLPLHAARRGHPIAAAVPPTAPPTCRSPSLFPQI